MFVHKQTVGTILRYMCLKVGNFFFLYIKQKMNGAVGWRNSVPSLQETAQRKFQRVLQGGGSPWQKNSCSFLIVFFAVYILLLLMRPPVVVYNGKKNVPYFHHESAFLWSLIAGGICLGLLQY